MKSISTLMEKSMKDIFDLDYHHSSERIVDFQTYSLSSIMYTGPKNLYNLSRETQLLGYYNIHSFIRILMPALTSSTPTQIVDALIKRDNNIFTKSNKVTPFSEQ